MRTKKILFLLATIMAISLLPTSMFSAFAANNSKPVYRYRVTVKTTGEKHSEGDAGKVQALLVFGNQTFYGTLNNAAAQGTTEKPGSSIAQFDGKPYLETTLEPYMLYKVGVKCNSTNGFKVGVVSVDLLPSDGIPGIAGAGETMFWETFNKWVDMDDGHPQVEYMDVNNDTYKRYIPKPGNFSSFGQSFHFGVADEPENTTETVVWDGLATVNYKPENVSVIDTSAPPTLSATVSGLDSNGVTVDGINVLANKGIFAFDSKTYSFSYNKKKVKDYMNQKGANCLKVEFTLRFSDETTRAESRSFTQTMTFVRDVFTLDSFSLSDNFNNALVDNVSAASTADILAEQSDNRYYADSENKIITVTAYIKTQNNYSHIKKGKYNGKELKFSAAYLTSSDGSVRLDAVKLGTQGKASSATVDGYNQCVKLYFPYKSGLDTANNGLKLVIEGGKISADSTEYVLWNDETNSAEFTRIFSRYKLDSKKPTGEILAAKGADGKEETPLQDWSKYKKLTLDVSEDIFSVVGEKVYEGSALMGLTSNGYNAVKTYKYNYDPTNIMGTAGSVKSEYWTIPAVKDGADMSLFVTPAVEVEGEYNIIVKGYDRAGNYFSTAKSVKLDNKPPTVVVREQAGTKVAGQSLTNKYNMTIEDGSGTGTLYYVFTEKSKNDIIDKLNSESASDESEVSGELASTVEKWAYIKRSDISDGETMTAVLSVPDGGSFNGRLVYYAEDAAGNVSGYYSREINIDNRNTTISVSPECGALPLKSYKISIVPQSNANKIEYCWVRDVYDSSTRKTTEEQVTDYSVYTAGSVIDTASGTTANLNGEYYLKIKVTPPNGSATIVRKKYVFDNEGPQISIVNSVGSVYGSEHRISVSITDAAEVVSATARPVNPDGSEIGSITLSDGTVLDKIEDIKLNVKGGMVSESVLISGLPNGAYALKVTAYDTNGTSSTNVSGTFFIRSSAPDLTVSAGSARNSDLTYNGYPLVEKDGKITLRLNLSEAFANSSQLENQALYYRTTSTVGDWGSWKTACNATDNGSGFHADVTVALPYIPLVEGENTLYVQAAICTVGADVSTVSAENIITKELTIFYDETAPTANLVIEDAHTKSTVVVDGVKKRAGIVGCLVAVDNLNDGLTAECDNPDDIVIGKFENGEATVTVYKNADTVIKVYDAAGNMTEVKIKIEGLDDEPPAANLNVSGITSGERLDARATVELSGVSEGSVRFALIPANSYNDSGVIDEKYFRENLADFKDIEDFSKFKLTRTRATNGRWDGESDLTYRLDIAGMTGKWYIGVRASDSVGNEADYIFKDLSFFTTDAMLKVKDRTVTPSKTETTAVATVKFNVPVYVLPQESIITDSADNEAANLELARENATSYKTETSLIITKPEGWDKDTNSKFDYELYAVDEIGRAKHITITFNDDEHKDEVTFGVASGVSLTVERKKPAGDGYTKVDDTQYIASQDNSRVYITSNDSNVLLKPVMSWEDKNAYTDGFTFIELESTQESGANMLTDESGNILGYGTLVYEVNKIVEAGMENGIPNGYFKEKEENGRFLTVAGFLKSDPTQTVKTDVLITGIDNTSPIVEVTSEPEVITLDAGSIGNEFYANYIYHPTPTDVVYTVTAQDKETGIAEIVAVSYYKYENGKRGSLVEVKIPLDASSEDYTTDWSWDGNGLDVYIGEKYNEETNQTEVLHGPIPVTIQYYGDENKYSAKRLWYTFGDSFKFNDAETRFAVFKNGVGQTEFAQIEPEGNLHTDGIIYKMPIEEGTDFGVRYSYENSDGDLVNIEEHELDTVYYKNVKAEININGYMRGLERGVYVANNGGYNEKLLNNYQNTYTFVLKDKLGYSLEKTITLNNFDVTAGEIEYNLSTAANTCEPITLSITARDEKSGVGKVWLVCGDTRVEPTQTAWSSDGKEEEYEAQISKNGAYSIVLYDKAGNKTVKSFNVKNIDMEKPTLQSVTYKSVNSEWTNSADAVWTARPVTATLTFSKQDVTITAAKPSGTLTADDYSINYRSATITFTKSGTLAIEFTDAYGNVGEDVVTVSNIDTTPPTVSPTIALTNDCVSAQVSFNKVSNLTSKKDSLRDETEIYVSYGGVVKPVKDEDGNYSSFVFGKNGTYSFRVYDDEGLYSICNVEIDGIDTSAPKITKVTWEYGYDWYDAKTDGWFTSTKKGNVTPSAGAAGYRLVPDTNNNVTNQDVTVTIETDSDTRLSGTLGEYDTTHERVYGENGMFIFNAEKKNGLLASYGVDIQLIDKTAPVIDLLDKNELLFYENSVTDYDISMLKFVEGSENVAYKAYDIFNGKEEKLTEKVEIDWGDFKYTNEEFKYNTFDSSKPYTIKYKVSDSAHNVTEVTRTVRLVGMYDTVATVNGVLPNYAGKSTVYSDKVSIALKNFSGTAYVRYERGIKTMGQMKKMGTVISKNQQGEFEVSGLSEGWYTFYIQTDKRDYFTLCVYVSI